MNLQAWLTRPKAIEESAARTPNSAKGKGGCTSLEPLIGLVVKASASRAKDPGFDSCLRRRDFYGSRHTGDLKSSTTVATLPGTWRYGVGAGTG